MNIFNKHPASIGETYWQHLYFASIMGGKMLLGGIACLLHAIFPFLFEKTGSNILISLLHQFIERNNAMEPRILSIKEHIEKKQTDKK